MACRTSSIVSSEWTQSLAVFAATAAAYVWLRRPRLPIEDYRGIELEPSPSVTFEEALEILAKDENAVLIDTRTPKEYEEAHAWGAVNIPLMSNDQRHLIGLTYHEQSKQAAIDMGWRIFSPRITDFCKQFDKFRGKRLLVYCWRGGMRSRIVVNLLRRHGHDGNVQQVTGGYKHYLNKIVWKRLDAYAEDYKPHFIVVTGHTGTRKTEILHRLASAGLPMIDLEGLAGHRSSIYGAVDMNPQSQKMFSIGLYAKLHQYQNEPYIFLEGEAHKVGDVHVPQFLCRRILSDRQILVTATMETRIANLKREYLQTSDSVRQLHQATDRMRKYIGNKNTDMLHKLLDDKDFDTFTEWLLVNHYDMGYRFQRNGNAYDLEVSSDDMDKCCAQIMDYYHDLLKKHRVS